VPGRRWVCGLRRELGSWESVHVDSRYMEDVRPFWQDYRPELNCGDWPPKGVVCAECGVTGG
jgi:hypothetical protein